jgi:hypothetical protein
LRTGLVYVEGDREGETEEHLSPILRGVAAMVEGWAANEHPLGVHGAAVQALQVEMPPLA